MVAVHVIERAAALHRNAQPAEAVVADGGGYAVGHLLLVVGEEGVGRGRAARLPDARAARVVPVALLRGAVGVLHFRKPVLGVSDERLLAAGDPLVAHGHVAVGVVVEAITAVDAVDRVIGPGVAVAMTHKKCD